MSRFLLPAVLALTAGAMLATPQPARAQPAPVAPKAPEIEFSSADMTVEPLELTRKKP